MKKLKIMLVFLYLIVSRGNAYAASVENLTVINDKNVDLQISQDVVLSEGVIDSEIKFFKDIEINYVQKDFNDQNKLELSLASDLQINKTYSLITIIGPDVNLDFVIGSSLEGFEVSNLENTNIQEQGLNRIVIKDSNTLELYFNNVLQEEEFEFKLLNELAIQNLTSNLNNKISLLLEDNIEKLSNYLIMILSVKDSVGNEVTFDEDLYELKTTQDLVISGNQEENEEENTEENIEEDTEEIEELESAQEDPEEENTLENVALNSEETPDTGPETTVLIVLTFITSSIIFIRKKIIKV